MRTSVYLESGRLVIRDIRQNDLKQMEAWCPFGDPLHRLWNIPRRTSLGRDVWLILHSSDPTRLWFVVERRVDQQVIGNITLREIVMHDSARLGIRFGAQFVDQGHGSEALHLFLPYYFDHLDFQRLRLDVAATNKRAIRVYQKLGFRRTGRHFRDIPDQEDLAFLEEAKYRTLRRYFRRHLGRMQLLFYDMVLERTEWHEQAGRVGKSPSSPRHT